MAKAWNDERSERHERARVYSDEGLERRERVVRHESESGREIARKLNQIIWLIFGSIMGVIAIRFVLSLMAANQANPFASFIYNVSDIFLWPFFGLTAEPGANGMVLELPALIAILVYALLAWFLTRLVRVLFDRPRGEYVETYEEDREIR
jgi:YggT family protein